MNNSLSIENLVIPLSLVISHLSLVIRFCHCPSLFLK
jgi:hypothetical protein